MPGARSTRSELMIFVRRSGPPSCTFSPRLAPASLHVERGKGVDSQNLRSGLLSAPIRTCHPVRVAIEFVTKVIDDDKIGQSPVTPFDRL
jgi:hypothetical protein